MPNPKVQENLTLALNAITAARNDIATEYSGMPGFEETLKEVDEIGAMLNMVRQKLGQGQDMMSPQPSAPTTPEPGNGGNNPGNSYM